MAAATTRCVAKHNHRSQKYLLTMVVDRATAVGCLTAPGWIRLTTRFVIPCRRMFKPFVCALARRANPARTERRRNQRCPSARKASGVWPFRLGERSPHALTNSSTVLSTLARLTWVHRSEPCSRTIKHGSMESTVVDPSQTMRKRDYGRIPPLTGSRQRASTRTPDSRAYTRRTFSLTRASADTTSR
jgi:hypothetical protein